MASKYLEELSGSPCFMGTVIQFSLEEEEAFLEVALLRERLFKGSWTKLVLARETVSCDLSLQADSLLFALPLPTL